MTAQTEQAEPALTWDIDFDDLMGVKLHLTMRDGSEVDGVLTEVKWHDIVYNGEETIAVPRILILGADYELPLHNVQSLSVGERMAELVDKEKVEEKWDIPPDQIPRHRQPQLPAKQERNRKIQEAAKAKRAKASAKKALRPTPRSGQKHRTAHPKTG
jgi:hypothetical protein